ncbi:coiled-coil domain-containing protein 130 homolog [Gigantopelta aegis]|uniref:coiled-coil domain-containing protein 130 homolog n=1 Tax=Gigantopelta aegis TaxID=1735272 RepID=UPI001B8887C2|nr:coiled-coil domain-containing protein 130 homolog [Gigantopelta aegis]
MRLSLRLGINILPMCNGIRLLRGTGPWTEKGLGVGEGSARALQVQESTSSLTRAERKAVNKYYPPDWTPSKGSINQYVGQHPLRDRARKLGQGILVIRFELPYNIWCGGCNSHVGMGVRYNAEKKKVGNYYSTPIYKFRMKCHLCPNYFEIQTDPQNHDYVILSGARRKEQRWDPKENEQIVPEDKATQKKLATDAMYKLEHGSDDSQMSKSRMPNLADIEDTKEVHKEDYLLNKLARHKFREEKKLLQAVEAKDKALLVKSSLDIALVKETEEDKRIAGLMKYSVTESFEEKQKERRKAIEKRPLFKTAKKPSQDTVEKDNKSTSKLLELANSLNKGNPFDSPLKRITTEKRLLGIKKKETPKNNARSPEMNISDSLQSGEHLSAVNNSTRDQTIVEANSTELTSETSKDVSEKVNCDTPITSQREISTEVNTNNALTSLICTYSDSDDGT